MYRIHNIVIIVFILCHHSFGQLNIDTSASAEEMINFLIGSGVEVLNIQKDCPEDAAGIFENTALDLSVNKGILLTTGAALAAIGPNIDQGTTTGESFFGPGDPDLEKLLYTIDTNHSPTYSACSFEFDLRPSSDSLSFNFFFASEEYPEYVCANVNDIFGFFISGPGITDTINIALVPETELPVSINTINGGSEGLHSDTTNNICYLSNTSYYIDNLNGTRLEYDGYTTMLSAKTAVNRCDLYHLKLAIADVGDDILDSGIFIESKSISSVSANSKIIGGGVIYESCEKSAIVFIRQNGKRDQDLVIKYLIEGEAINGIDYDMIDDSITIPANTDSIILTISAIQDTIIEGSESIKLLLLDHCSGMPYDSIELFIVDTFDITILEDTLNICYGSFGQPVIIGGSSYQWIPSDGLSNDISPSPQIRPESSTQYVVIVGLDEDCDIKDTVYLYANVLPQINYSINIDSLTSEGVVIVNIESDQEYQYLWSPDTNINCNTCQEVTIVSEDDLTYYIQITDSNGCIVLDSIFIKANKNPYLKIPSVFSPNGDGINDNLVLFSKHIKEVIYYNIYNRWGQLVFTSQNLANSWNGQFNEVDQESGVYTCSISAKTSLNDSIIKLNQNIVLIR